MAAWRALVVVVAHAHFASARGPGILTPAQRLRILRRTLPKPKPMGLWHALSTDWMGYVKEIDDEQERLDIAHALNATAGPAVQEGDVIVWRGIQFSARITPIEFFNQIDEETRLYEAGKLPGQEYVVDDDGKRTPVEQPFDTDAAVLQWERHLVLMDRAARLPEYVARALLLLAAVVVSATPALRAPAVAYAHAAVLACARWHTPASRVMHGLIAPLFGLLFAPRIREWLSEPREGLPITLVDVAIVRARGHAAELAIGAMAAAAGAGGAFGAGSMASMAADPSAHIFRFLALLVAAQRELMTLSALWWWTDLVSTIRNDGRFFGKIGRAFRRWHAGVTVLSAAGLALFACQFFAGRSAVLAAAAAAAPPPVGVAGVACSATLACWRATSGMAWRGVLERLLATRELVAFAQLGGHRVPALLAGCAAYAYLSYAFIADLLALDQADPTRRHFKPALMRGGVRGIGARTPAARWFGRLGLRPVLVKYRMTRAATRKLSRTLSYGSVAPEFFERYDPYERPPIYKRFTMPDDKEAVVEVDEDELPASRPWLSARDRRMRELKRQRDRDGDPDDAGSMLPVLQAISDRERDERKLLAQWEADAAGDDPRKAAEAVRLKERLRRRYDRSEWGSGSDDAARIADRQLALDSWARRTIATMPPVAYELETMTAVEGTDDLREAPPPPPQLTSVPPSVGPAALRDVAGEAELRTLTEQVDGPLPFRQVQAAPVEAAAGEAGAERPSEARVDADTAAPAPSPPDGSAGGTTWPSGELAPEVYDKLAKYAAEEAMEWEPEPPDTMRELERRAKLFLGPDKY